MGLRKDKICYRELAAGGWRLTRKLGESQECICLLGVGNIYGHGWTWILLLQPARLAHVGPAFDCILFNTAADFNILVYNSICQTADR